MKKRLFVMILSAILFLQPGICEAALKKIRRITVHNETKRELTFFANDRYGCGPIVQNQKCTIKGIKEAIVTIEARAGRGKKAIIIKTETRYIEPGVEYGWTVP